MNTQGIDILDYHAGDETDLTDPTDPHEKVERVWMDKLAKLLTCVEEVLDAGSADFEYKEFVNDRGAVLDFFDDPDISEWLDHMRKMNRCRFRKFAVRG